MRGRILDLGTDWLQNGWDPENLKVAPDGANSTKIYAVWSKVPGESELAIPNFSTAS
jgi:hypothetical protein